MKKENDKVKIFLSDGCIEEISVDEFLGKKISELQKKKFNGRSIVDIKFL